MYYVCSFGLFFSLCVSSLVSLFSFIRDVFMYLVMSVFLSVLCISFVLDVCGSLFRYLFI